MKIVCLILLIIFLSKLVEAKDSTDIELNALANMSLEQLLNVKITTAGKKPEELSKVPASVVVMSRKEIERHGFISLEDVLETIPGLYAINDFAFNDVVFGVRGFWSSSAKQILILVNGVRQTEAYASSYVIRNVGIPVEAIDRIEVVRGPNSVLYGSGAFFAAINIITDNSTGQSENIFSTSYGSRNMNKVFLRRSGKEDGFSYAMNASIFRSDGMDLPYQLFTDVTIEGIPNMTHRQLENEEKYFNFSGSAAGWSVDFTLLENPREQFFFGPSRQEGYINRVSRGTFSLGYNSKISNELSYAGRFNYINQVSQTRGDCPPGFSSVQEFYGQENIDTAFIELEANAFLNPTNDLDVTLGVNVHSINHILDQANLPTFGIPFIPTSLSHGESIDTFAMFGQTTYSYSDRLTLVAGVRLEKQSAFDILFESYNAIDADISIGTLTSTERPFESSDIEVIPRVSMIYSTDKNHIIKLLYGQSVIRPSFSQLQFSTANRLTLTPEYISTYEVNYVASVGNNTTVNLSAFHNEMNDLIVRTDERLPDGSFTNFSANSGKQVTNGVELAAETILNEDLSVNFSVTYQQSRDQRTGFEKLDVAYSPDLMIQFRGEYQFNGYTFAFSGNFIDRMETLFVGIPGVGGSREGASNKSHWVLNSNLHAKNIFNMGIFTNFRISNILDEQYYYPAASFNRWADKGLPGDERIWMLSVGINF
ncbi:MAG: TonB-dependent receptor [Kangiellaceae bacterium]|nr:TonB-dependent receptor [Kangiellaceae bacterium]